MPCEMCGRDAPLRPTAVEGTEMRLCPDCQRYGTVITRPVDSPDPRARVTATMEARAKRNQPRDVYAENPEMLAEDYGPRVKRARDQRGWTVEELAKQINEKKSVVSHVETMDHHPSDQLVRKLERALEIKLMEAPERTTLPAGRAPKKAGPVTLGDLLKDALKKDKS